MNDALPTLKTLVRWAEQASDGDSPDVVQARSQSPEFAARWTYLLDALRRLDDGEFPSQEPKLPASLVAAYVEDRATAEETAFVEATCWTSVVDLMEVVSELRFAATWLGSRAPESTADSTHSTLVQRLHALGPAPLPPSVSAPSLPASSLPATLVIPRGTPVTPVAREMLHESPVALPNVASVSPLQVPPSVEPVVTRRNGTPLARRRSRSVPAWVWAIGGAAAVVVFVGIIVWQASTSAVRRPGDSDVARDDGVPRGTTNDRHSPGGSEGPRRNPESSHDDRSNEPPSRGKNSPLDSIAHEPSGVPQSPPSVPAPPGPDDVPPRRNPNAPPKIVGPVEPSPPRPRPETPNQDGTTVRKVALVKSELGAILVPGDQPQTWRVGNGERDLQKPLPVVSLAESWSTADVPGWGTLVFEGETRAVVSRDSEQSLRVTLLEGRVGVRDLKEQSRVQFEAGGDRWEMTGVGSYSTFGVVRDFDAANFLVTSGIIAVDGMQISAGQTAQRRGGAIAAAPSRSAVSSSPFVPDPLDDRWLKTPDDKRRRDWQTIYGKLVERLAAADDASAAIHDLREAARDGRQHALAARWNLTLSDDRTATLWEMLGDRQKFVRLAAAREFLGVPPGDGKLRAFFPTLRAVTDNDTAMRMMEWMARSHRAGPLPPAQAQELVDGLGHQELAVRQLAVVLLEFHSQDALRAARLKSPAFEADDPAAKRVVAQTQWRTLAAQLFGNRARGAVKPGIKAAN